MIDELRSAATASARPFEMADGLFEEWLVLRSGHVANEDSQDTARVCQYDFSVHLKVGLAAVTDQDELAFGKVAKNLL